MPLRCLLFSSDEARTAPIRQVLTELGVEAEHCQNPVDAVERVTTQLFQIVITDWQDQPEAAFLLKTARDLKAAARPLTLAIVSEENRPHALQAGANSVLLNPIRPEQVRDTMSTAIQLLRSKLQTAAPASAKPPLQPGTIAAAGLGTAAAAPAPAFAIPAPEKLRAGDFMQSPTSKPGAQFDTESEIRDSIEASSEPVDSLTDLEPMAASVQDIPEATPQRQDPRQDPLTGWAALQARLTKSAPAAAAAPAPAREAAAQNELLSYEATPSFAPPAAASEEQKFPAQAKEQPDIRTKVAVISRTSAEHDSSDFAPAPAAPRAKRGKIYVLALALVSVALVAVPRTRERIREFSRTGARAALRWLNPPPAPLPQTVTQHDSFGQPDDEYKLPATGNIPDSTTDPSKIEVVPVVDPTAKPDKSAASSGSQSQTAGAQPPAGEQPPTPVQNAPADQNSPASASAPQNPAVAAPNVAAPSVAAPSNPPAAAAGDRPANPTPDAPANVSALAPVQPASSQLPAPVAQHQAQPASPGPARNSSPSSHAPASEMAGIPSSLKSQIASTTPEMSGANPDGAAGSSIEPVKMPESAVRALLAQAPDPEYPAAAQASGQQGGVVLQVLIGPDGAVQDAKFMQGSFVFARAAIDAVKQWRFKPYSMNGRAVSVQSVITLNFKPPA